MDIKNTHGRRTSHGDGKGLPHHQAAVPYRARTRAAGPANGDAVPIPPGVLPAMGPASVALPAAGRGSSKRPRDEAPATGIPLAGRSARVAEPEPAGAASSLFQAVQSHFASSATSAGPVAGGGKRPRQHSALGAEIRDWLRAGRAGIGLRRLREGLQSLLGSLHTLPEAQQQPAIDALAEAIGRDTRRMDTLDQVLREPFMRDDQASECTRRLAHAMGERLWTVLVTHGRLQMSETGTAAARWVMLVAGMLKGLIENASAGELRPDLVRNTVPEGSFFFFRALAIAEGGAQAPPAALERWCRLVLDTPQPVTKRAQCLRGLAFGVASPTLGAAHAAVFERLWREPLGTDAFQDRTELLFAAMHPHRSRPEICVLAVADALPLPLPDGWRLLRALQHRQERWFAEPDDMLHALLLALDRADPGAEALLRASLGAWPLKVVARTVLTHARALRPATTMALGQACAATAPADAAAADVRPVGLMVGLMAALVGLHPWLPVDHALLQALVQGYATGLATRSEVRAHWVQAMTELTDHRGAAGLSDRERELMFYSLGAGARSPCAVPQVLPALSCTLEQLAPARWAPVLAGFASGLKGDGLPADQAVAVATALDSLAHGAPLGSAARALLESAETIVDPVRLAELMRAARPRDLPVRDGKAGSRPPEGDARVDVARANALLAQATQLPPPKECPALPEIAPEHREAARLWLAILSEYRHLPRVDHHPGEHAAASHALSEAMKGLAPLTAPDATSLPEALRAFRHFMVRPGARTDAAWLEETIALGWRLGMKRLPEEQALQFLGERVARLHTLADRRDVDGTERDPILMGLFQLLAHAPQALSPDMAVLGRHLRLAMRHGARHPQRHGTQAAILQGWIADAAGAVAVDTRDLARRVLPFLLGTEALLDAPDGVRVLARALHVKNSPELTQDFTRAIVAASVTRARIEACMTSLVAELSEPAEAYPVRIEALVRAAVAQGRASGLVLACAAEPLLGKPPVLTGAIAAAIRSMPLISQSALLTQLRIHPKLLPIWHLFRGLLWITPAQGRVLSGLPDDDRTWLGIADALALQPDEVLSLAYAYRHAWSDMDELLEFQHAESLTPALGALSKRGSMQFRSLYDQALQIYLAGPASVLAQTAIPAESRLKLYEGMLACAPSTPDFARAEIIDLQAAAPTPDLLLAGMLKLVSRVTPHLRREDFRTLRIRGLDAIRQIELEAPAARATAADSKGAPGKTVIDPRQAHADRMLTAASHLTGLYQHLGRRPAFADVYQRPAASSASVRPEPVEGSGAAAAWNSSDGPGPLGAALATARKTELLAEREFLVQEFVQITRPEHPADIREQLLALITQFLRSLDEALAPVPGSEETPGGLDPAAALR